MGIEEQRKAVVEEARSWIGTPFHFGACLKGVGVACGPFLVVVHQVTWYTEPCNPFPQLAKDWHCHTKEEKFLEQVQKHCHQVALPLPGDFALFRLGAKDRPYSHGAIILEWPQVIHAHFHSGVEYADASKETLLLAASETTFWSPWV